MNYEVYHIPTNFTDAGRVMGLFELRNLVEAVVLTIPVLYLCIAFLPFSLSTKIMVTLVAVVALLAGGYFGLCSWVRGNGLTLPGTTVSGLPGGQTVDIDFDLGIVYVDGEVLDESYTFEPTYRSYLEIGEGLDYPVTVPEGSVFVLGDNRNHSADSRYAPLGCVDESRILGRVLLRILPGRQTNEEGDVVGGRDFRRIGAVS